MTDKSKETADAGRPGATVNISREKDYTAQEVDNLLMAITGDSHVNITNKGHNARDSRLRRWLKAVIQKAHRAVV